MPAPNYPNSHLSVGLEHWRLLRPSSKMTVVLKSDRSVPALTTSESDPQSLKPKQRISFSIESIVGDKPLPKMDRVPELHPQGPVLAVPHLNLDYFQSLSRLKFGLLNQYGSMIPTPAVFGHSNPHWWILAQQEQQQRILAGFRHPANGLGSDLNAFWASPFRKMKRIRTAFNPHQLLKLERAFEKNHYVVGQERKQLARDLNLTETQVKVWFQNRRTKQKRVQQDGEDSSQLQKSQETNDEHLDEESDAELQVSDDDNQNLT